METKSPDFVKVAAMVIRDGALLMVRDYNEDFWKCLGGTIKGEESHYECCSREVLEEVGTGVKSMESKPIMISRAPAGSNPNLIITMHCYLVELEGEPKPTYDPTNPDPEREVAEIAWIKASDIDLKEVEGKLVASSKKYKLTAITENFISPS